MEGKFTLHFKTLDDLWAFRIEALISMIEMNTERLELTCICSNECLQLAVKKYKAAVLVVS